MIPGAFERQQAVCKRIPRERQRSARPVDVEARKLCLRRCGEEVSERQSAQRYEVKGRR